MADPFHQAPVADNRVNMMVDDGASETRRQVPFANRHADGVRQSLAERPGRRLDALRMAVFRVAGRTASELAETFEFLKWHVRVAGEIKQCIEQHRPVACRKDEAVTIRPIRGGWVEFQEMAGEHGRHVRHAHRHARVAGLCFFHGVHREYADRVGEIPMGRRRPGSLVGAGGESVHGNCDALVFDMDSTTRPAGPLAKAVT